MQEYSVSYWCGSLWTYLASVSLGRFPIKSCKSTVSPIGVGLFGHLLGVSCLACFLVQSCENTVYLIGVGLVGHLCVALGSFRGQSYKNMVYAICVGFSDMSREFLRR